MLNMDGNHDNYYSDSQIRKSIRKDKGEKAIAIGTFKKMVIGVINLKERTVKDAEGASITVEEVNATEFLKAWIPAKTRRKALIGVLVMLLFCGCCCIGCCVYCYKKGKAN